MKFFMLISLLFSLAFSSESRLVVGSFQYESNAKRMKDNIEKIIQNDQEFKEFLDENSINVTYKLLGKYYAVSFEPFSDPTTKFRTYFKLKKRYADTYSLTIDDKDREAFLAAAKEENVESAETEKMKLPTPLEQKSEVKSTELEVPTPLNDKQEDTYTTPKKEEAKAQEQIKQSINAMSAPKKAKHQEEQSSNKLPYLIPLLIVVLLLVMLIVYFNYKRKPKKELQTLQEEIHEELS